MDMTRFSRVIGARWAVVLAGALIGLGGAIAFINLASPSDEAVFEATATMRFDPAEGETIPDVADDVREAREFALIAAEEALASDPTSQITIDLAEARMMFIAQGRSPAQAEESAQALLDAYLAVDPDIEGRVDDELIKLEDEAKALDEQIDALEPELTEEQLALIAQQTQLDTLIANINGRLSDLVLAEAAATTNEAQDAIDTERANLEAALAEAQANRAALGPVPTAEMTTEEALLLETLQARKELLNAEYQRLYLRKLGVAGLGIYEGISVETFTATPIDPVLLAVVGFVAGGILAAAGLLLLARTRRTVWLPKDVELPVLGQIPARPVEARSTEIWYDHAEPGPRKTAVQALRSAVQAHAHSSGSTIAFTGYNIASEEVQALAADLAGSMATAGESVLLIDANFDSRSALGEYKVGGMSLADVLRLPPEAPEYNATVEHAVERAYVVRPGLAVIPSGPPPGSPADALAGRQFRSLIAAAENHYDVTIIVVDEIGTPASQVAMQRLRHGILVLSPGSSTESEIDGLLVEADRLRIDLAGAVFVGRRSRWAGLFGEGKSSTDVTTQPGGERTKSVTDAEEAPVSPMTRLHNYSIPDERRSSAVEHSPLGELATSFGLVGAEQTEGGLGTQLLGAMGEAAPERAYEAVADFTVSRAEDMVTAKYGYGDLIETLIEDVSEHGFLSLLSLKSHRTVGSWLTEEIEREIGEGSGADVVQEMVDVLSRDQAEVGLDEWLDENFMGRHLARTEGQPEVWHLVSPERTVSILVPARRMTVKKLEGIIGEVVPATVDELERKRKAAVTRSDLESAAGFEQQVWDVRLFEKSVRAVLYGPAHGESKRASSVAWDPDWSRGTRVNLAPFQVQGLLPFDVLSEEELNELLATA